MLLYIYVYVCIYMRVYVHTWMRVFSVHIRGCDIFVTWMHFTCNVYVVYAYRQACLPPVYDRMCVRVYERV